MKSTLPTKLTLALSGLVALGVGLGILFSPRAFHASAGIALGDDVNLLNEMRAPGGMIIACGLFALAGAVRERLSAPALGASAVLYLSFGLSRLVGVAFDGAPNAAMTQIIGLELAIAVACLGVLGARRAAPRLAAT